MKQDTYFKAESIMKDIDNCRKLIGKLDTCSHIEKTLLVKVIPNIKAIIEVEKNEHLKKLDELSDAN